MKIKKYILLFAILGLAVLAFSVMAHNVSATDHEWTGSISPNGTAYQNYTLTVRPEPIITLDLTTVALSIIFLSLVTIFNIYGDFKKALLIQLVAIAIMLPAVVWTFMAISGVWYIPLLFVVVNLVIFVMAAARRK